MHKYQDLKIWQKAMDMAVTIYQSTADFPKEEKYGLISQMRRSAISVPSNIAEGAGRSSDKEFNHFLSIATGSCYELETQVVLSNKLGLLSNDQCELINGQLTEIQKMIYVFQQKLSHSYN